VEKEEEPATYGAGFDNMLLKYCYISRSNKNPPGCDMACDLTRFYVFIPLNIQQKKKLVSL
jgi:hypothetical protein